VTLASALSQAKNQVWASKQSALEARLQLAETAIMEYARSITEQGADGPSVQQALCEYRAQKYAEAFWGFRQDMVWEEAQAEAGAILEYLLSHNLVTYNPFSLISPTSGGPIPAATGPVGMVQFS
jgi:hypothetical protein